MLGRQRGGLASYAGNLNVAGLDRERVQQVKDAITHRVRQMGFRMDVGVGFLINAVGGTISPIASRLQIFHLALKEASSEGQSH